MSHRRQKKNHFRIDGPAGTVRSADGWLEWPQTGGAPWRPLSAWASAGTTSGLVSSRIKVRLRAYEHQQLDLYARDVASTARRTGARVKGPIPLPTRTQLFTVNRSPHVDKRSREQFWMCTHSRLVVIDGPNALTIAELQRFPMVAGVDCTLVVLEDGA